MAAMSSSTKNSLSFALSYGLTGGPMHARKLKKLLKKAGHSQTSITKADIIIAHSAGCWLIPADVNPRIILYIGMPLAQAKLGQTWRRATSSSLRSGVRQSLQVKLKSSYYSVRQPRRNLDIMRMARTAQPRILPQVPGVFIANRHDPWPHAEQLQSYLHTQQWSFIHLPGSHDDIWEHPERYMPIIIHYARLLD
jgi:hypothetical protein